MVDTGTNDDTELVIRDTGRVRNWSTRLKQAVDAHLKQPFDWATDNCGDLMATSIRACHGDDHPLLSKLVHGSEEEVKEVVAGKGGLKAIIGAHLQSIPTLRVQDGDIVLLGKDDLALAGCIFMSGAVVGRSADRVWRVPITQLHNVVVYRV